jgi:Fic family protein
MARVVHRWQEVAPPEPVNGPLRSMLETVDELRVAWKRSVERASPEEFAEARRRTLRRHAIETGIIERLYDVSWGVTEALVAEGLTLDVAEREGGISLDALGIINTQFEALTALAEAAGEGRDLTVFFVRELHQAITRHQATYEARNDLGQVLRLPLRHGQWKSQPNHVVREDGSILEYVPPEHVQSQMERLIELHADTAQLHPIVAAAWLHHRFIQIHPFQDGNGRVARALVLLVLLRKDYAPLVVDRRRRDEYLRALDLANAGDLAPLVRLFAGMEIVALRSELTLPTVTPGAAPPDGAVGVAQAYVDRLRALRETDFAKLAVDSATLASEVSTRIAAHVQNLGDQLQQTFAEIDPEARARVYSAAPPDERAKYWFAQLVRAARQVDFYTNLTEGTWWTRLHLTVLGQTMRYIAAVQKVGHGETGVLAVTVFAERLLPRSEASNTDDEPRPIPEQLLTLSSSDSVTLVHTDTAEERWQEVAELIDRTLAAALDEFSRKLG